MTRAPNVAKWGGGAGEERCWRGGGGEERRGGGEYGVVGMLERSKEKEVER